MTPTRRIALGAGVSFLQVLVGGVVLFFLYRFLLRTVGDARLGVWSLLLATTSASSIANLGFASTAVKFVSQYRARKDEARVVGIFQTAALSLAVFLALALLVLYPLFWWLLGLFIDSTDLLALGRSLLPYTLVAFWLSSNAAVVLSTIDGYERVDLRGYIYMFANILFLILALTLVPERDLRGLAEAQIVQASISLVLALVVLARLMPAGAFRSWRWDRSCFNEMLRYNVNSQGIAVMQLLVEPTTKSLISRYGGVETLAYFEMAYRMVTQIRALIVSAHAALVPTIAGLHETNRDALRTLYVRSFQTILVLVVVLLPLVIALTPWVARVWISTPHPVFILSATLLSIGWFTNLLGNPAYFANTGTGHLRPNVIGHALTSVLNVVAGYLGGLLLGWSATAAALMVAIMVGSAYVGSAYNRLHAIGWGELITRPTLYLFIASVAGLGTTLWLNRTGLMDIPWPWHFMAVVGTHSAFVIVPFWAHPLRRSAYEWIRRKGTFARLGLPEDAP